MKRLAGLLAVSLCLWLGTSAATAQKCKDTEDDPILDIVVKGGRIYYPDKYDDISKLSICRNRTFWLRVNFEDDSVKIIKFSHFRATFTKGKKWRQATQEWPDYTITIKRDLAKTPPYTADPIRGDLPTRWKPPGIVKVRIILVTVEVTLKNGSTVTFDPPWAERP